MSYPEKTGHSLSTELLSLQRGHGCFKAPGQLVIARAGMSPACVGETPDSGGLQASLPTPLELAARVDHAIDALEGRARSLVLGADMDPLLVQGPAADALLAAAIRAQERGLELILSTRGSAAEGAWGKLLTRAAETGTGARLAVRLFTLDESLASLYEASAPAPEARLESAATLFSHGVQLQAEVHPMLPWIGDSADGLEALAARLARAGLRRVYASYLHLNARGHRKLSRLPPAHRALLRGMLREAPARHGGGWYLPAGLRIEGYRRFSRVAARFGISVFPCAAGNPDLQGAQACLGRSRVPGIGSRAQPRHHAGEAGDAGVLDLHPRPGRRVPRQPVEADQVDSDVSREPGSGRVEKGERLRPGRRQLLLL